jgi:hypothetical protein
MNSFIDSLAAQIKDYLLAQPVEINCDKCGGSVYATNSRVNEKLELILNVEPCETCVNKACEQVAEDASD